LDGVFEKYGFGIWLVLDGLNWIYDGIHWKLRIPSLV
jgi:hypothetical protein